jgi:hypothetical protein
MTISEAKLNLPTANRCRTKPHLLVIDDDVAVADTLVMVRIPKDLRLGPCTALKKGSNLREVLSSTSSSRVS